MVEYRHYVDLAITIGAQVLGAIWATRMMVKYMRPEINSRKEAAKRIEAIISILAERSRGRRKPVRLSLSEYECMVAEYIVDPVSMQGSFDHIGGLQQTKAGLYELLEFPLIFSQYKNSKLLSMPKGILLYGPPGTGKTMLARAIAGETDAVFFNIQPSAISSKWYGESQKLIAAVFSLARKVSPAVIFVDEIDSFLRVRDYKDHEVTAQLKTEFMSLWDGLANDAASPVVVMGATNLPWHIDPAVIRRFTRTFLVDLPTHKERAEILRVILKDEHVSYDFDFDEVAGATKGYSGSNLVDICRCAVMTPLREAFQALRAVHLSTGNGHHTTGSDSVPEVANGTEHGAVVSLDNGGWETPSSGRLSPMTASEREQRMLEQEIRPLETKDVMDALRTVAPTNGKADAFRDQCHRHGIQPAV